MLSPFLILLLALFAADAPDGEVLTVCSHHFHHLGIDVREVRTLDAGTGSIIRTAFGPDGVPVDVDALRMAEQKLEIAARGKISPELGRMMEASAGAGSLPVVFWLRTSGEPDFRGIMQRAVASGIHGEDARRMARDEGERFFAPQTRTFGDLLSSKGYGVDYVGTCWPIVFATLPVADISTLAAHHDVDQVYYSFPSWQSENNYAQPTMRTPTVHGRGNTGGDDAVKVMVHDIGIVYWNHPYLPAVNILMSGGANSHSTAVAGNVCMQNHNTLHGSAPGLNEIYSAVGWDDVLAPEAWDLAMQAGVSFGNCSWWNGNMGSIVFLDRFFDYIIRNYGVMMFKSNGNLGYNTEAYSTSPGNGYNMLSSGCFNDNDTYKWSDDTMAGYSSYMNPVEGHEKPEVVSPGDNVDTAGISSSWIYHGFNGTSSSSPLTMGVAILAANRDPSIITHPEAVKAIVMVTAWHNVEGDAVLSDKDGAGGVHAGAADAVARDGQYETGTFTDLSFPYEKTIHCYKGDGTRVICLWQSDPDSSYATDVLKMDLDLTVLDPNNQVVATSASIYNPFELAYFEPALSGDYTIRLTKQTFLGTTEPYCIAWSSRQDAATAKVQITGTGQIGTTMDFDFFAANQYDEKYIALLSLSTLPSLINLKDGYILPIAYDNVANACYAGYIPGFVGFLDGNGEASTSVSIPNDPSLIGKLLYCSMVTLDPAWIPTDTAEAVSFVIS